MSFCRQKQLSSSPGGSTTCPQEIQWLEKARIPCLVYAHTGAVTLDPPVLPSLPGRRRSIFFLRVGKKVEKATPCWITAAAKPSNLQGASAFSVGHGNQIYRKRFQPSTCAHGNKALWSSCHLGRRRHRLPLISRKAKPWCTQAEF